MSGIAGLKRVVSRIGTFVESISSIVSLMRQNSRMSFAFANLLAKAGYTDEILNASSLVSSVATLRESSGCQ